MKKLKHSSLLLLASLAITVFFSCRKKPDMPPVQAPGDIVTIKDLKDMFVANNAVNYKFTKDVSLYATVAMSDNYKTLYLKDNTGAIVLKQLSAHGIFEGDSLRINLNGSWLDLGGTATSIQIDSVDVSGGPTNKVIKLAYGKTPSRMNVTIAQLNASASSTNYSGTVVPKSIYDGQVVQIDGVQFSPNDSMYYIPPGTSSLYLNHTLYDCGAMNNITVSLYKGTTDFQGQKVPSKYSGSIVAAVTFYNNTLQLTPRSFNDMSFTHARCGVDTLTQSFASWLSNITNTNYNTVTPGWFDQTQVGYLYWVGPYNVSAGTGFASGTNYGAPANARNVMWLISPPIQNSPTKNLSFQTSFSAPSGTHPKQLSVFISTDYNGSNLGGVIPSAHPAHWYDITAAFPLIQDGSVGVANWPTNASAAPVTLNQYVPQLNGYNGTFYIGFRYTAHMGTDSIQTINVQNVSVKN